MMKPRRRCGAALSLLAGWALVAPPDAAAQAVGYTGSFYTVRGTYDGAETDGLYVFNAVDVSAGPVRVAFTIPWVQAETAATTVDASGAMTPLAYSSRGIGDPVVRGDLRVWRDRHATFQIGAAGAVKLPVADLTSGLGTGEMDVGAGATAFKAVNRTSLMADVMYWHYGDPAGIDFVDTWSYSIGVGQVIGQARRWSVMGSLSGFTTGLDEAPPPRSLTMTVLALSGRNQSIGMSASVGLNDSASDFSLGVSWRLSWHRRALTSAAHSSLQTGGLAGRGFPDAAPDLTGLFPPAARTTMTTGP